MSKINAGMKFDNLSVNTAKKGTSSIPELISKDGKTLLFSFAITAVPFEIPEPECFAAFFAI